jgi:hypothetical protein
MSTQQFIYFGQALFSRLNVQFFDLVRQRFVNKPLLGRNRPERPEHICEADVLRAM